MLSELLARARTSEGEERTLSLEEMSEVFARGKWSPEEGTEVVSALVEMAAGEEDPVVLEILLNDLVSAYDCGIPLRASLMPLVPVLDRLDENLLDYALHLLGQSRQVQFLPIIDRFSTDPREAVRESAQSAMSELMGQTETL
jgi:hypothetical protein